LHVSRNREYMYIKYKVYTSTCTYKAVKNTPIKLIIRKIHCNFIATVRPSNQQALAKSHPPKKNLMSIFSISIFKYPPNLSRPSTTVHATRSVQPFSQCSINVHHWIFRPDFEIRPWRKERENMQRLHLPRSKSENMVL